MAEQDVVYAWVQIQTADGAVYPFAIDPASYVKRDIVDFAPRSGGGDVAYSNLDLYQIVTQDSWHHGIGFINFRDKFGFRISSDEVDARHVGMAMMFQKYTADYPGGQTNGGLIGSVDFAGATYFNMGLAGVYKRTTAGVWSVVLNASVNELTSNGSYLIASIASGRMKTSSNGTTWVDAGVSGNPPDNLNQLEMHNGFMWGSEVATSTRTLTGSAAETRTLSTGDVTTIIGNGTIFTQELSPNDLVKVGTTVVASVGGVLSDTFISVYVMVGGSFTPGAAIVKITNGPNYEVVHFWSSSDSSDAEGGGVADISAINIGMGSLGIKGMSSFNGALHIARPDGVWAVDDTVQPPVARRVLNFSDEQHSSNFAIFIPWRGRLYFNIKNMLYAYNGSSLANVTPPTYSLDFPPLSFGGFVSATYRGPYLYIVALDNTATPHYHLLAFDGTGWFSMTDLGTSVVSGVSYSPLVDMLFVGTVGAAVRRIPFQTKSELPYPDFTWGLRHTDTAVDNFVLHFPTHYSFATHVNVIPNSITLVTHLSGGGGGLTLHWYDDGAGVLVATEFGTGGLTGTVNYATGECDVPFISAMETSTITYSWNEGTFEDHFLNLSEIDFGFRRVIKSFAEIDIEVYNVISSRYVMVDYSADGGAWHNLGRSLTNGVNKLNMIPTVEANKLDVRLNFQTATADQSPVLRNFTIKAMIRPDTLFGHQMIIIGSNEIRMLDNRFNPGSSEQQKSWVEAVRSSKAPITFIDMFGVSHTGYVSTVQFLDITRRPGESQNSWQCRLNIVEVR